MPRHIEPSKADIDEQAVEECWDGNADLWTRLVRHGQDLYREVFNNPAFFAFLPDLAGLEVLDLGCGEGYNTRLLAERGLKMTGIDLSARMIDLARELEAAKPLGICYLIGSYTELSGIPDKSFDAAVSTMALMDSARFDLAAKSVHRVLRPGGSFTFSVLHPCFVTPGMSWVRGGDGEAEKLVVADYFCEDAFVEQWTFKSQADFTDVPAFDVPRFSYRLEHYVNGLSEAGFRITRMLEPRPSESAAAKYPWLRRLRHHAALFLYFSAEKVQGARGNRKA